MAERNVFLMRKIHTIPSGQSNDAKTWWTIVNTGLMLTCMFVKYIFIFLVT